VADYSISFSWTLTLTRRSSRDGTIHAYTVEMNRRYRIDGLMSRLACAVCNILKVNTVSLIACSHRRHGQDKTVLSCPCPRCEHNWRQDKTWQDTFVLSRLFPISKFSVVLNIFETEQLQIGNWVETRQNSLELSPILFTPRTRTRQESFVLSVSAVWTGYKSYSLDRRWRWMSGESELFVLENDTRTCVLEVLQFSSRHTDIQRVTVVK